jgi:hypothetical protein
MSYLYAANLDPRDRSDQLEFQLDDGSSAIIRLGHYYDLSAGELDRARRYVVMLSSTVSTDEEPTGIVRMPIKGNPTDGQVALWDEDEDAFVPADVPGVSGGPFATTAELATKVSKVALADVTSIFGVAYVENTDDVWYGKSINVGDVADSFGFSGSPTTTPATTTTAGVTFPLTNATVPVADCAQLSANGGSFTLGGKRVAYLSRSAASGAGNATGCYSATTATGTVASGTALGNTPDGFFGLTVYKRFGYDGRPNIGSTQAFGVVASYRSPTLDDSAEAGSFVTVMADSGSAQTQHRTVTGGEMTAQTAGNWSLLDGITAPLKGGGVRTQMTPTDHVRNAMGLAVSHIPAGFLQQYDGIYQGNSVLQVFGTLNGAATLPQATIPVTGTFPPATATNPVTVLVGPNPDGIGGQPVTYTGQSGGSLTGCTGGTGTIATGSQITNIVRGVNMQDPLGSAAGFLLGDTAWSASMIAALRGGTDSIASMLALTGPTNAEVSGGLTQLRLNAGSGQTKSIVQVFDTGGTNRLSISSAAQMILNGSAINMQQSGSATARLDSSGYMQLGSVESGVAFTGSKKFSCNGSPVGRTFTNQADGDFMFRKDGAAGASIYQLRAGTWVATAA